MSTREMVEPQTVVIAMGGHAFMRQGESGTHVDHVRNGRRICAQLMTLVERGYNVVVTHGNGPQVGDLLRQTELTREQVSPMPLDVLADQIGAVAVIDARFHL